MSSEYGADNSTERASKKRKRNAVEADDIVGLTLYKIGEPQLLLGVAASALKKFIDTNKAIDDHQQRIDEIATQFKRIKRNIEGRLMSVEPSANPTPQNAIAGPSMTTESIDLDSIKGEMRRILHDMGVFIDFGRYQLHDMAPLMAKLGLKILSGHLAGWGEKAIGKAEKGRGCKARETRLKTSTEKVKANLTNLNGLSEAMQEVRDALREI